MQKLHISKSTKLLLILITVCLWHTETEYMQSCPSREKTRQTILKRGSFEIATKQYSEELLQHSQEDADSQDLPQEILSLFQAPSANMVKVKRSCDVLQTTICRHLCTAGSPSKRSARLTRIGRRKVCLQIPGILILVRLS